MTKQDACRFFIRAWEKLKPEEIRESFNYFTIEERRETVNCYNLKCIHTIKYNNATRAEKKK